MEPTPLSRKSLRSSQPSLRRTLSHKRHGLENLHFKYLSNRRNSKCNSSASEEVLYSPELLESILIHLSQRELLTTVQRVSHLWKSIIDTSPSLQQKLFFRSVPRKSDSDIYEVNPLLLATFHPFLRAFGCYHVVCRSLNAITLADFQKLDWNRSPSKRIAYRRKDASWRRMLISHPAIKKMEVRRTYRARNGQMSTHQGPAVINDGVRMGVLYDLAQDAVSRDYALNFRLVWKDIDGVCVMHGHRPEPPPLPTTVEAAGISKETEADPEPELKEPGLKIEHLVSGITAYTKLEGHFRSQGYTPLQILW